MRNSTILTVAMLVLATIPANPVVRANDSVLHACLEMATGGIRPIAEQDRLERFLGKVGEGVARCRGDENAVSQRGRPWVDWSNYWATGDSKSKSGAEAG